VSGGEQKAFNREGHKENRKANPLTAEMADCAEKTNQRQKVPIAAADLTRA